VVKIFYLCTVTFIVFFFFFEVLVVWKDNKAVYAASNKFTAETATTVRRYDRAQHKHIQVPIPTMIAEYNRGMGGVDLLDNMVSCYRLFIFPIKNVDLFF